MTVDFLGSIDSERSLHSVSAGLIKVLDSNPKVKETVRAVFEWIHGSTFDGQQLARYQQLGKKTDRLNLPNTPGFVKGIETMIYLQARDKINGFKGGSEQLNGFIISNLAKVKPVLNAVPKNLLGGMTVMAEEAINKNPLFFHRLDSAANEIQTLGPHFDDHAPKWLALQPDNDEEDCWCVVCGTNNLGQRKCFCIESWFDCILIVLGIIILIIVSL